jgi:hypothetical protein
VAAVTFAMALLAEAATAGPAGSAPPSSDGRLSTVTLIDVSRLPGALVDVVQPGAEDGLVFLFLVARRPGAEGVPTVREMRDVQIDRASYRERTVEALGAAIEPVTFMEDANDFLDRVSPGAVHEQAVPDGQAFVVVTTIGGARLPESGRGTLEIEVGWGGKTEPVSFTFAVPPEIAPDSSVLPAVPGEPQRRAPSPRGIST